MVVDLTTKGKHKFYIPLFLKGLGENFTSAFFHAIKKIALSLQRKLKQY